MEKKGKNNNENNAGHCSWDDYFVGDWFWFIFFVHYGHNEGGIDSCEPIEGLAKEFSLVKINSSEDEFDSCGSWLIICRIL